MNASKINTKKNTYVRQGSLLCATPINPHPELSRTLVLITRHNNLGSAGIILNNPMGITVHLSGLFDRSKVLELHNGGPDDDRLSFLVSMASTNADGNDSAYWCVNLHVLFTFLGYINPTILTLNAYKGSMRWLPGQLNEQVLKKQWWMTDSYSLDELTSNKNDNWSSVASKTGGHFAPMVEFHSPIIFN